MATANTPFGRCYAATEEGNRANAGSRGRAPAVCAGGERAAPSRRIRVEGRTRSDAANRVFTRAVPGGLFGPAPWRAAVAQTGCVRPVARRLRATGQEQPSSAHSSGPAGLAGRRPVCDCERDIADDATRARPRPRPRELRP